jgi:hypothetical protein
VIKMNKLLIYLIMGICLSGITLAVDLTHTDVVFEGDFNPGATLYSNWVEVRTASPDVGVTEVFLYGSNVYPDDSSYPTVCEQYRGRISVCANESTPYQKWVKVDGKWIKQTFYKMVKRCHYEYVMKERCYLDRKGPVACPTSNVFVTTNLAYTIDDINWYTLPYKTNKVSIGVTNGTIPIGVKFRATIPTPCRANYPIENIPKFVGYEYS